MQSNTTGGYNTAVGRQALYLSTTAVYNTAIGYFALVSATTGGRNTNIGAFSGQDLTSGGNNTLLGYDAGDTITTGSNNVCIGYDVTTETATTAESIVIGRSLNGLGANYFTFGTNGHKVYNQFTNNATWTRSSDVRLKKDIETNTDLGLDFINDLRTVTYKWKAPSELDPSLSDYDAEKTEHPWSNKMYGFIAQEVKQALDDHNVTDFNGWHVTDNDDAIQGISYEMFVMPLVKAVQELSAENAALKARLDAAGI